MSAKLAAISASAQTARTDVRAAVGGFSEGFRHRLTGRGALSSICFLTAS